MKINQVYDSSFGLSSSLSCCFCFTCLVFRIFNWFCWFWSSFCFFFTACCFCFSVFNWICLFFVFLFLLCLIYQFLFGCLCNLGFGFSSLNFTQFAWILNIKFDSRIPFFLNVFLKSLNLFVSLLFQLLLNFFFGCC